MNGLAKVCILWDKLDHLTEWHDLGLFRLLLFLVGHA